MRGGRGPELSSLESAGLCGSGGFSAARLALDICAPYIVNYGTEEQKHKYLPKICSGETIACIGMTEPGAGSDLQVSRVQTVWRWCGRRQEPRRES